MDCGILILPTTNVHTANFSPCVIQLRNSDKIYSPCWIITGQLEVIKDYCTAEAVDAFYTSVQFL